MSSLRLQILALGSLLLLSACATTPYQKLHFGAGYRERLLGPNEYLVMYLSSDQDFSKRAARYRLLELGKSLGLRYFKIESEQVREGFGTIVDPSASTTGNTPDKNDNLDPTGDTGGLVFGSTHSAGPDGYNIKVQYYKVEPLDAHYEDINKLLESESMPNPASRK